MEFRLLGPLEVRDGTTRVPLGGRKQRALLARLLLEAGRTVSVERLVDDLWGHEAPDTAAKMVQIHVSQLRKALPAPVIVTRPPGYAAEVDPQAIDVVRFRALHDEGRAARARGDPAGAADLLRRALALWRGPALAEFSEPFAAVEAAQLDELRLVCLEERIDADLDLGAHDTVAGELEALVARHPYRERLRVRLLLALYRSGRQPEALAALRAYRRTLADELGLEPSQRVRDLEQAILRQDPALLAAAPASSPPVTREEDEVRFVRSGDVSIAYQVVGDGPLDLVLVHGWVCPFLPGWEYEPLARFYRRLAALGRLILFDKRGTGLSDRVSGVASLEERIDDVRAVMDAVGSERAVLLGISEGGPLITLFAATHPRRTVAVVALSAFARRSTAPGYPIDIPQQPLVPDEWGLPFARRWAAERAPSVARDEEAVRWYASYLVRGASPGAAAALREMNLEIDVRPVLPTVHVPALVLYRERDFLAAATRYMGERIPGARVVALAGGDHLPWEGDQEAVLGEIERFLAAAGVGGEPDRILTTVLCAGTGAADAGDDGAFRDAVARFRGSALDARGPMRLARFDGPARAIRCATALAAGGLRAGVHTGECDVAPGGVSGAPLEVACALARRAAPGEVLVSDTVRDLVAGAGLAFAERGSMPIDGDERRDVALFAPSG